MADMLVKLYELPEVTPRLDELRKLSLFIRQAQPGEKRVVAAWAERHFPASWAVGCEWAIEREPISCYIAVEKAAPPPPSSSPYHLPAEQIVGFACYDVASKGMFGAMGVQEDYRARGIGRALLLTALHAMAAERYAYAVIGWAGSVEFYHNAAGATVIEGSEPGIFRGQLAG